MLLYISHNPEYIITSPAIAALTTNNVAMCQLLLKHGADFDFSDEFFLAALDVAVRKDFTDGIMHVLCHCSDVVDPNGALDAMRWTCEKDYHDILTCILEHGCKVHGNYRWWGDICPCGIVIDFYSKHCLDVLLRWGAIPDITSQECIDYRGKLDSVFYYAFRKHSRMCMEILVEFNPYFLQDE